MQVSVKEAHAMSCALKRHIDSLKTNSPRLTSTTLQIVAGQQLNVPEWMATTLATLQAEDAEMKGLLRIYFHLRNLVSNANHTVVSGNKSISRLVAMLAELDSEIEMIQFYSNRVGNVKAADIEIANRTMALDPSVGLYHGRTSITGCATSEEAKAIQTQLANAKSMRVKMQKAIDRINATLMVEISEENASRLESIGLL